MMRTCVDFFAFHSVMAKWFEKKNDSYSHVLMLIWIRSYVFSFSQLCLIYDYWLISLHLRCLLKCLEGNFGSIELWHVILDVWLWCFEYIALFEIYLVVSEALKILFWIQFLWFENCFVIFFFLRKFKKKNLLFRIKLKN